MLLFGRVELVYSMRDLLDRVRREGAEALRIRAGSPPVLVVGGKDHVVEGPAMTAEEAEGLFRGVASTRQMRELRERGSVKFIYTFRRRSPFLVQARLEEGKVGFDLQ